MKWVLVNSQICCKAWNSLETQLPRTVSKPVSQNQSDKEATNTASPKHRLSLSEGHILFRSVTLGPIAGSVVRKWKRKKVSFLYFERLSHSLASWQSQTHLSLLLKEEIMWTVVSAGSFKQETPQLFSGKDAQKLLGSHKHDKNLLKWIFVSEFDKTYLNLNSGNFYPSQNVGNTLTFVP